MTDIEDGYIWGPSPTESIGHYSLFLCWLKAGPTRSIKNLAEKQGMSYGYLRTLAGDNDWTQRGAAYDEFVDTLKPTPEAMDVAATRAAHLVAGQTLLDMGLSGLQVKRPEALSVAELRRLVQAGAELQHRANGGADLTLHHRVSPDEMEAIDELLGELDAPDD